MPFKLDKLLENFAILMVVIIFNTTIEYSVLYGLIVLALQGNHLRNLVYKVINLGVLSVFVIALWALLTGNNLAYVIYILAFVGAVVMLFLSVILMLPSSAITPSEHVSGLFAIAAQPVSGEGSAISSLWGGVFSSFLILLFYLVLLYGLLMLICVGERSKQRNAEEPTVSVWPKQGPNWYSKVPKADSLYNYPNSVSRCLRLTPEQDALLARVYRELREEDYTLQVGEDQKASKRLAFGQFYTKHFFLKAYDSVEVNDLMVKYCEATTSFSKFGNCGHYFEARRLELISTVQAMSPLCLVAEPAMWWEGYQPGSRRVAKFLRVLYEFVDYYIRVIEPLFMTVNASRFNLFVQLTYPARRLVGARHWKSKGDLRDYLVKGGRRCTLQVLEAGTGRKVFITIFTPWWSPFNLIPKLTDTVKAGIAHLRSFTRYLIAMNLTAGPDYASIKFPSFKLYEERGLKLSNEILLAIRNRGRAFSAFRTTWFVHGFQYYFYFYIDSRLSVNNITHRPDSKFYTAPSWSFLEKFYYPARPVRDIKYRYFPFNILPETWMLYEPTEFGQSVASYTSILWGPRLGRYAVNASNSPRWYNAGLFSFNSAIFLLSNLLLNAIKVVLVRLIKIRSTSIESGYQGLKLFSVYGIAIPISATSEVRISNSCNVFFDYAEKKVSENLTELQHILYTINTPLLFVSVTGLLVALVGAAILKS